MNWQNYLRGRTRDPAFLWRMVLSILAAGMVLGYVAPHFWGTGFWGTETGAQGLLPAGNRLLDQLAREHQWWQLGWAIPGVVFPHLVSTPGPLFLAGWAGLMWLLFLSQTARIHTLYDLRFITILVAVGLGFLSIWPTHFFHYYQEYRWQLVPSHQLGPGLRYFVLGVGLCEEFAKFICLLPLLMLLRKQDELLVLSASAAVGLGFAIAENAGYFLHSGGSNLLGRFLTANPLHMGLTGLIGLSAFRGIRHPQPWGPQAVALFGVMVIIHGMYDAALALPALAEYAMLATILFIGVMYQFFRELRTLRPVQGETISLTANFLLGISLATAVTFVYLSVTIDWVVAWKIMVSQGLSLSLMVYLFLREMPETLVSV